MPGKLEEDVAASVPGAEEGRTVGDGVRDAVHLFRVESHCKTSDVLLSEKEMGF